MHMLHFQLQEGQDVQNQLPDIKTHDFYYNGPQCTIRPHEVVVCVPCVCPLAHHQEPNRHTCQLRTVAGWQEIDEPTSVVAYVFDNYTHKTFVLENGESLFRFITIGIIHGTNIDKCKIASEDFFGFERDEYDSDEDDFMDTDSGIDGDFAKYVVVMALEDIDYAIEIS
jgi:hypothetical protein